MTECKITYISNAGVSIEIGGRKILVDAIAENHCPLGFTGMSETNWQKMLTSPAFQNPDLMVFTHDHPDHFCRTRTAYFLRQYPNAHVVIPEERIFPGQEYELLDTDEEVRTGGVTLHFHRTIHMDQRFRDVPHYALLLEYADFKIFICGDTALCYEEMIPWIRSFGGIDLAMMNFHWVVSPKGRKYLEKFIAPDHIVVFHIPYEEDDVNGFRQSAIKASRRLSCEDVRLLLEPLQTETIVKEEEV